MAVVVVESPAKAKTINKYLGPDFTVLASYGHVRDLPPKDGSVDPEQDFRMEWEVAADSKKPNTSTAALGSGRQPSSVSKAFMLSSALYTTERPMIASIR